MGCGFELKRWEHAGRLRGFQSGQVTADSKQRWLIRTRSVAKFTIGDAGC
jgi:hypothetical protein